MSECVGDSLGAWTPGVADFVKISKFVRVRRPIHLAQRRRRRHGSCCMNEEINNDEDAVWRQTRRGIYCINDVCESTKSTIEPSKVESVLEYRRRNALILVYFGDILK